VTYNTYIATTTRSQYSTSSTHYTHTRDLPRSAHKPLASQSPTYPPPKRNVLLNRNNAPHLHRTRQRTHHILLILDRNVDVIVITIRQSTWHLVVYQAICQGAPQGCECGVCGVLWAGSGATDGAGGLGVSSGREGVSELSERGRCWMEFFLWFARLGVGIGVMR
jgi:hypothetical protein